MSKLVRCSLLLVVALALGGCASKYRIADVVARPGELANKPVTVSGVVSGSEVLEPARLDEPKIRGKFVLKDKSGEIQVMTTGNPPPQNADVTVTGTVNAQTTPPTILQTSDLTLLLYGALVVLVVFAVVLIVMLTRKPRAKPQKISTAPPPPPPPLGVKCQSCGARNDQDAKHCEACGKELQVGTAPPRVAAPVRPEDNRTMPPPSSGPAAADVTVVETAGKQLNMRFELTKDAKGLKIGRDPKTNIPLDDETVSKEHARIWWNERDASFVIQDENSTWGTVVKGQKVARAALNDGDEIMLGKTKLVFRLIGTAAPGSRTVPPPPA